MTPVRDSILVKLTAHETELVTLALASLRDLDGEPAWNRYDVRRLRTKIADTIAAQVREVQP